MLSVYGEVRGERAGAMVVRKTAGGPSNKSFDGDGETWRWVVRNVVGV